MAEAQVDGSAADGVAGRDADEGRGGRDEPFKVLIVEDDRDLAGVLTASFDRHGIQTFHAADGAQAILISQRELPDLLVLDLGLPEVDGFAVVEWLRGHERLHAMPMVVYTARDLDDGDRRRLQLGSTTQFLTKDVSHHRISNSASWDCWDA